MSGCNENITDEPTPYPAPTYYGCDAFGHPTKFYKTEWVEHARQLHDGRKDGSPSVSGFTLATPNVGIRIVPFDGDVASIPTRKQRKCVVESCGAMFVPITAKQQTCSMKCSRARDKQRRRDYYEQQKAKVS